MQCREFHARRRQVNPDTVDRLSRSFGRFGTRRSALVALLGTALLGAVPGTEAAKGKRRGKRARTSAGTAKVQAENKPQVEVEHVEDGPFTLASCGSFDLIVESDYVLTTRRFFDKQGNLTMLQGTASGTDTFINSGDLTKSIEASFQNTFLGDPQTPQRATTGIIFKVIVPGVGAVLLEIGRLVFQAGNLVFQAGPQQFTDGDLDALCEALA
jgi:hypothetical protein